jgi:hypothetical protein
MKLHAYSIPGLLGLLRKSQGEEKKTVELEVQRREKKHGRKYPRPY